VAPSDITVLVWTDSDRPANIPRVVTDRQFYVSRQSRKTGVRSVRTRDSSDPQEQEDAQGRSVGAIQVLPVVQEACCPQGDQIGRLGQNGDLGRRFCVVDSWVKISYKRCAMGA